MPRLEQVLTGAVGVVLVSHLVVTAFDNLPTSQVSIGMRLPAFKKIPQWRFFAPNPGVENLHVMYRTGTEGNWGQWREISFRKKWRFYSAVWNPGGRAAKALFDVAYQLRILAGFGSAFDWVLESEGYRLMIDLVQSLCLEQNEVGSFQFMILAAMPNEGEAGMKPILVSRPESIAKANFHV
ncbi:hypothetical protein [Acaricomes phytoseiuli]|uniref:hypothetical protein n=1 Tax=Acaricomes phytoseiuli TaxID=291968 RepID=UPI00035E0D31|nr:hypothetical protein [Acaricomes phytoseiuli]